jgi:2-phospho-L-lactate/phosphoenolpyruvate guanylyltransferase
LLLSISSGPVDSILIPVKQLDLAKLRLASRLLPGDRRRLGLAMLSDVLKATDEWRSRFIVTSDPDAEALALASGCSLIPDLGGGLNQAVEQGTAAAIRAGVEKLLVLASDLPLVSGDDLARMFSFDEQVVIAPSSDGGTNALLRRPPAVIGSRFGPGSAAAHRALGEAAGVPTRTAELTSLLLDIDRYTDLVSLGAFDSSRASVKLARELVRA